MRQRRKNPRINVSFTVGCCPLTKKKFFYTVSKDLSLQGIKLLSSCFFPKGTKIKLQINLIDKVLRFIGEVVWCNEEKGNNRYLLGFQFVGVTQSSQKELNLFLEKISPAVSVN